ncbi:MAG: undecaprenyl-diphosphatase UppP [Anaerolineales bacterium]|nr:undecaprenyl-diphosphatase UppP [Anaerolineales bacterium]
MSVFQAVFLGIVQGLTEFLPISSSAHLVLLPHWLGWSFDSQLILTFDVFVHMGTLLAVVVYFRRDIGAITVATWRGIWRRTPLANKNARLGYIIVLATAPAAFAGMLLKDFFEKWFDNPRGVSALLLATALLLLFSEHVGSRKGKGVGAVGFLQAMLIGCFQALAILPGISRSGATIAAGLMCGLERSVAARFSFLMAVPVMIGAGLFALRDLFVHPLLWVHIPVMLSGFLAAVFVGLLSITWLMKYLQRYSLGRFSWYCALVGLSGLLMGCGGPIATGTAMPSPEFHVGVTPATQHFVKNISAESPIGGQITVEPYSSNRRLLKAVQSGGVDIGVGLYRPEEDSLVATPLALTSLRIIVHPEVPIQSLSLEQLRSVFTGVITDWHDLGGRPEMIKLASRETGTAARLLFEAMVLGDTHPSPNSVLLAGDDLMVEYVVGEVGAIGYAWQALVGSEVRILSVSDEDNLLVPVYAFSFSEPSGGLRDWLAWIQSREAKHLPNGFQALP